MKKVMKVVAFGLIVSVLLVGCSKSTTSEKEDSITLKLAHVGSDTHQYNIAAEKFGELVEEKSEGKIKIEIHGNSTLGSEAEVVEQVMDGTIEMTIVSPDSSLANTVPELNIFGLPYLFDSREDVYAKLDGDPGKKLLSLVEKHNMKGLGYWEIGFRHISNNKREINTPEDLKGLKIRVQPAPVWEAHMNAMGASATPVAFNELYSALDQGVVDGQENPMGSIYSMKFYEVQKYIALTSHTYTPAIVLLNNTIWEDMNDDQKKIIEDAVSETTKFHREYLTEDEDKIIAELKEQGIVITEPDRAAFREATKNVKDALDGQIPAELIEEMQK